VRLPSKAARRYAKAFFDVAEEAQATEAVRADFASLRTLVAQTPALFTFMRDKRLPHAARLKVWTALLGDRAQPLTLRFVAFLEAKRRGDLLPEVGASFAEYDDKRRGIKRGRLEFALAMDPDATVVIAARMSALLGGTVALATNVSPSLLGGFRLQVGDQVYDASVAARLRMLREALHRA